MIDSLSGAARSTPAPPLLPRWQLVVLCGWLCVVGPLAFAFEVQGALPRLARYGAAAWLLLACRAAVVVLGVSAGRLLWRGEPAGLRVAAAWALLSAGASLVTAATPYFPGNRPPSMKRLALVATVVLHGVLAIVLAMLARGRR